MEGVGTGLVNINAAFVGSVWGLILFSILQLDPTVGVADSSLRSWCCTYRLLTPCQTIHIINPFLSQFPPYYTHTHINTHCFNTPLLSFPWRSQQAAGKLHSAKPWQPPFNHKHPLFYFPIPLSHSEHSSLLNSSNQIHKWTHTHTETSSLSSTVEESSAPRDEVAFAICSLNSH